MKTNKTNKMKSSEGDPDPKDDEEGEKGDNDKSNDKKKQLLRETLDSLHREMDVASYSKSSNGQYRRVTPKKLSKTKTRKRKLLEREDYEIAEPQVQEDKAGVLLLASATGGTAVGLGTVSANDDGHVDGGHVDGGHVDQMEETTKAGDASNKKKRRLRGSRLALEQQVVDASMPFLQTKNQGLTMMMVATANAKAKEIEQNTINTTSKNHGQEREEPDTDQEGEEVSEHDDEDEDNSPTNDNKEEVQSGPEEEEGGDPDDDRQTLTSNQGKASSQTSNTTTKSTTTTTTTTQKKKRGPYKKKNSSNNNKPTRQANSQKARRRLFRLKNFKSYKMAQRHGEALGAHARGLHKLAIARLKQIAKDAPSAPQVYSSLGMVYTDMYQTCWNKFHQLQQQQVQQQQQENDKANVTITADQQQPSQATDDHHSSANKVQFAEDQQDEQEQQTQEADNNNNNNSDIHIHPDLREAIDLAQKAYGSYHIAAILCKKDYSLWVRAADTACDIATLYQQSAQANYNNNNNTNPLILNVITRQEQERWYKEAKGDLQTADNLKPPTLDVPIKLARLYMELGYLSEAITLWMDLLQRQRQPQYSNNSNGTTGGGAFRHQAWMLYADCMLRIGYECREWNAGRHDKQQNYMFRRWLRKFSHSFDWKERRLQGLVLALAAAAGTKATARLMQWMRQRAQQRHDEQLAAQAKEQAAVEFAMTLVQGEDDDDADDDEKTTTMDSERERQVELDIEEPTTATAAEGCNDGGVEGYQNDDKMEASAKSKDAAPENEPEGTGVNKGVDVAMNGTAANTGNGTQDKTESVAPQQRVASGKPADAATSLVAAGADNSDSDDDSVPIAQLKEQRRARSESNAGTFDGDIAMKEANHSEETTDEKVGNEKKEPILEEPAKTTNADEVDDEFEHEKRLLLDSNAAELAAFDQTTAQMLEVLEKGNDDDGEGANSRQEAVKERKETRRKMTRYHRAQLNKLAAEYQKKEYSPDDASPHKDKKPSDNNDQEGATEKDDSQDLPMDSSDTRESPVAASSRVVTQIASQLMKLLLEMQLFTGGRLTGEAVSLYMRERARIYDKKMERRRMFEQQSDPLARLFSAQPPTYDDVQQDGDSSDDEEADVAYLSDDNELESETVGPTLVRSLRRGALPPEVSVLFSLCLIHEGGRDFVARKCMDLINQLEPEGVEWLSDTTIYNHESSDADWQLYRSSAVDSMGKVVAYALVAETLRSSGKDSEWGSHFAPMFLDLVEYLEENGLSKSLSDSSRFASPASRFRVGQIVKCISACGLFRIKSCKKAYETAIASESGEGVVVAKESALQAIQLVRRQMNLSSPETLVVDDLGSISEENVQTLNVLAEGYSIIDTEDSFPLNQSKLEELVDEGNEIVSWMSMNTLGISPTAGPTTTIFDSTAWDHVPLPSTWQSVRHKAVSTRCYNLCVSFNVSHFSGWEPHEFSLRLMKTRASCTFFGLKVNEGLVSGFLPDSLEKELERQWESLGGFLPAASNFKFTIRLAEAKQAPWYKEGVQLHKDAIDENIISMYAELEGLQMLLAHSRSCLTLARRKEAQERYELLMNSLSVLLPITQFYLNQRVWDSEIGRASALDEASRMLPPIVLRKRVARKPSSTRKRRPPREPPKRLDEWFPGEDRSNPLSNTVKIPSSALQRLWGMQTDLSRHVPTTFARRAMKKVHDAMEKLRVCYTDAAVEKASLQVACALLDLASVNNTCENPFLVLQQAAIFAGHGTKRGNSVDLFREPLPEPSKCLPYEALVILGRADCFQAVYFPYEAAYLCAYVARVCNMHRDSKSSSVDEDEDDGEMNEASISLTAADNTNTKTKRKGKEDNESTWNNQWMIVGVLCYNVSITVRATAVDKIVGIKSSRTEESYAPWDQDVVDELLLARSDAVAWKTSLDKGETTFAAESCSKKVVYDDEDQTDNVDSISGDHGTIGEEGVMV